jgi:phosphohistidine phosphatase
MQLLLIRHADAGERNPDQWPDDRLRPLTSEGRKSHRKVAKRLRRHGLVPSVLLTSPWLRAWQTAEETAEVTGGPAPVASEALAKEPDIGAIAAAIGRQPPDALVALVGHEPWLSELASLLLADDAERVAIDLPKSGVIGLEAEIIGGGSAVLEFFWRPKRK